MQARVGDMLIYLSGGEGVEHLAVEYALQGQPAIPLDSQLGSSCDDGIGGAAELFGKMRAHPQRFMALNEPNLAGTLLTQIETRQGQRPPIQVVNGILKIIEALKLPTAFYVRLLKSRRAGVFRCRKLFS
jgi:hypothetical protein